ncbi:GNAT family N-acetyltransferase [Cohnella faecalis]|uniref:GNAT family N-acetyltransferase n=1 Tax=Cohnella faecalis TaxID=2315694 RepID=UPI0013144549|nr:GNAT family N-acetyltransferase [Cohnella faecalis]
MNISYLFSSQPVLETERLILRRLQPADANEYFHFASDPLIATHTMWSFHETVEDTKAYLDKLENKYEQKTAYHWAIHNKQNRLVVGRTGFIRFDHTHDSTEIGFVVSREYWKQGIMTEATRAIIEYGFEELGVNRIESRCNEDNIGSERVMQKLDMNFEGILREQLKIKGEYVNQKMYAILKRDFEGHRASLSGKGAK